MPRPAAGSRLRNLGHGMLLLVVVACGADPDTAQSPPPTQRAAVATPPAGSVPNVRVRFEPEEPISGNPLLAQVEFDDPSDAPTGLRYRWSIDERRLADTDESIEVPLRSRGARIEVQVIASNARGSSDPVVASAEVVNSAPRVEGLVLEPHQEASPTLPILARATGSDADEDRLTFRYVWYVDETPVDGVEGDTLPVGTFARGNTVRVEVVANDGELDSEPRASDPLPVGNAIPVIASNPPPVDSNGSFHYPVVVEDDDRMFRYRLLQSPKGMEIDPLKGIVDWTPTLDQVGKHRVELEVDDLSGGIATQLFELEVTAEETAVPAAVPEATGRRSRNTAP